MSPPSPARPPWAWLLLAIASPSWAADPPSIDLASFDAKVRDEDRQHWAFQPIRRPSPPEVEDASWVRNPIDRFVLAKLEEKGWKPSPSADARTLLRRLHFDLTGLPPSLVEQESALKDTSADAFDRIADDLLARPSHGERWARHWLDLVRFAETNGYERDALKPNAWRYRDYVIRSLNEDKPFDRFLLEQVAGDELPDGSTDALIATGLHRLGPWDDEPADPAQDRFDQLDDIVSTTGEVFLGLTLGCARCHDHKFEPLTMHDYYRMVAVFDPLRRPQAGRTELDLPLGTEAQVEALAARDRKIDDRLRLVSALALAVRDDYFPPDRVLAEVDAFRSDPAARTSEQSKLVERLKAAVPEQSRRALAEVERSIRDLRAEVPDLPRGYFMDEPTAAPPPTRLLLRGQASNPGPAVSPGLPAVLVSSQPPFSPNGPTTGRRLALARWMADRSNPLTARVIVNRVWQFHFGEGLVRTPNDFGTAGDPPTHPELLDWLADWFVDNGWSLKKLHRLIVASNTYRMSTRWDESKGADDPDNLLLWRKPYRRLEVEAIRDAMLAVSGRLNPTMYGPSFSPEVPRAAIEAHTDKDKAWKNSDEREASRRTVYALVKRSLIVPMLEVLDFCDTSRSAPRRNVTSIAPQALTMLNGSFVNQQSRAFAERLSKEAGDDAARRIDLAYRLALARPPSEAEVSSLTAYLRREAEGFAADSSRADEGEARRKALEQMCRVIFNLNEFVYVD